MLRAQESRVRPVSRRQVVHTIGAVGLVLACRAARARGRRGRGVRRGGGGRLSGKPDWDGMRRELLLEHMLAAATPAEIAASQRAAEVWLARHPDDERVLFASEQLALLSEAALRDHEHGSETG